MDASDPLMLAGWRVEWTLAGRRHQSANGEEQALHGRTPAEAYRDGPPVDTMDKPLRALTTSPQAQQQQQEDRFKGILAA